MRLLLIEPKIRFISAVEGDPGELIVRHVEQPHAMVRIDDETSMACSPVGPYGNDRPLWWSRSLTEVFGGNALVVGMNGDGRITAMPTGTWFKVRRDIVFLGVGDEGRETLAMLMGELLKGETP